MAAIMAAIKKDSRSYRDVPSGARALKLQVKKNSATLTRFRRVADAAQLDLLRLAGLSGAHQRRGDGCALVAAKDDGAHGLLLKVALMATTSMA